MVFLRALLLISFFVCAPAYAQEYFGAPENPHISLESIPSDWASIPIKDRHYPAYTPKGLKLGGFTYLQDIAVGAGYNSNVFLSSNQEKSDQFIEIMPSVALKSDWLQHRLDIRAEGEFREYSSESSENKQDFSIKADGQIDMTKHLKGFAGLRYRQNHTDRENIRSIVSPDSLYRQDELTAKIGVAGERGKNHYVLKASFDNIRFKDALNRNNAAEKAVRSDADRDVLSFEAELGRKLTRNLTAYMQLAYEILDFKRLKFDNGAQTFSGQDRDSADYHLGVGIKGHITQNVRGHIFTGIQQRDFESGSVSDATNHLLSVGISWNPSSISTFSGYYDRRLVTDNDIEGESIEHNFALNYDHEVRRNLLLSGAARYIKTDYKTVNQEDEEYIFNLGTLYKFNDNLALGFDGIYQERDSDQSVLDYENILLKFQIKHAL